MNEALSSNLAKLRNVSYDKLSILEAFLAPKNHKREINAANYNSQRHLTGDLDFLDRSFLV